jgi:FkbM family methyltransferase
MHTFQLPPLHQGPEATLESAQRQGILILGYGSFAHDLAKAVEKLQIPVKAFVVTGNPPEPKNGIPVFQLKNLPTDLKSVPLWVGVFNHLPVSDYDAIRETCVQAQIQEILFPQHFYELTAPHLGWRYWLTDRQNYEKHKDDLQMVLEMLDGEASRQAFSQTLLFRLGQTTQAAPANEAIDEYFPDFCVAACGERHPGALAFLDGGAYDGDTLKLALKHVPFKQLYAFEPDLKNFAALTAWTRQSKVAATCYPCGLSGSNEHLRFNSGQGTASAVSDAGDTIIQVVRLDDCLQNTRIDYLKLDIEGQEIPTLEGGRDLIRQNRPILAIAAYHRWDDIWRIPAFVNGLSMQYRLAYISHCRNSFEGVFYAY